MSASVKDEVANLIDASQQQLCQASLKIKQANPMAQIVPAVMEMDKIAMRLRELVREVARMPGI